MIHLQPLKQINRDVYLRAAKFRKNIFKIISNKFVIIKNSLSLQPRLRREKRKFFNRLKIQY